MTKYYLRHNIKEGDIANLSDSQSEIIIKEKKLKEEAIIEVEAPNGIFLAQIVFIDKASVEIEIKKKQGDKKPEGVKITIIQSLSNDYKYDFFLEKAVEAGVAEIIPVFSEYSLLDIKKAHKKLPYWQSVIEKAIEQSRTPYTPKLQKPTTLKSLEIDRNDKSSKICLATEPIETKPLKSIDLKPKSKEVMIAIGPEKGWSSNDLEEFRKRNFVFASLKGNIFRTETAAIVIATIIKFANEEF